MNKKLIIFLLTLAFSLNVQASAENTDNVESRHANRLEQMIKSLDLDAMQKIKVEALFKEQKEKLKKLHEETRARLQEILTKEQMAKLDELKKQRRQKWRNKANKAKYFIAI